MLNSEAANKILKIVSDQYDTPLNQLTLETRFKEDLSGDSLDLVELTMDVEDEFNICLSDEVVERCKTIKDVVEAVTHQ